MQQFHTKGRENSGNYACFPPFHEPFPLIPSFSPSGGEGARRAVEGDCDRFMAPIHVRILEVSPSMNLTWVGTSRCDVPAREAAGGIVAPLDAARTARRAIPTRFSGPTREI